MTQKNEDKRLLPLVELEGVKYLVDIENRQLKDYDDTSHVINMHSPVGRKLVKSMIGMEWWVHVLYKAST